MKNSLLLGCIVVGLLSLSSCAGWLRTASRPELAETEKERVSRQTEKADPTKDPDKLSDKDLEKYAYELGLDPKKPLTETEQKEVMNRRRLRQLERNLDSPKERVNYSKVLPLFANDQEKIDYLSIPSLEGRQAWVNRNKLWNRDKTNPDLMAVAEAQDITLGMSQELVRKSWGEPTQVEHSGNPIYKNERWKYVRDLPTTSGYKRERRYVYFEGGRVVGWETE
ncbi:hypothetical protein [Pseudobdellovibrio sp. HCB154]|uniref:hypothetical protein n=1 Tax=Pseudobdellovibrio sp. HCB154 TaxID=3386277 RepID=UPI003917564C